MATIGKPYEFTSGTKAVASQVNSNFDTLYNDYNGNITNANLAAAAAIVDTKLATISTAGKVNATALTETNEAAGTVLGHDGTNWSSISSSTQRFSPLISMGSTSAARFVPLNLASASGITGELPAANLESDVRIKGWVNFDGLGTIAIRNSYNVAGVYRNGTGNYRIDWDTNFSNSSYAIVATASFGQAAGFTTLKSVAAGQANVLTIWTDGSNRDVDGVYVIALGDQ